MLIAAAVLVALSVGMWWMQRVAFTPSTDASVAHSILGDDELREFIERIALIPEGAALMSEFVGDAHGRLIGSFDDRVVITAQEQVNIVRNELVGEAAPLTLPVQEVGSIAFIADWLTWIALGTLGLGLLVALAGALLRPERGEGTFALGVFFASTAGSLFIFGYLVPLLVIPVFSDDLWMGVFSRLASHHRNLTLLLAVGCLVVAALIVFGTSSRRERRQHSTPLNVGRYRDERSWSR
jgi:hypothetical protein